MPLRGVLEGGKGVLPLVTGTYWGCRYGFCADNVGSSYWLFSTCGPINLKMKGKTQWGCYRLGANCSHCKGNVSFVTAVCSPIFHPPQLCIWIYLYMDLSLNSSVPSTRSITWIWIELLLPWRYPKDCPVSAAVFSRATNDSCQVSMLYLICTLCTSTNTPLWFQQRHSNPPVQGQNPILHYLEGG